MPPESLEAPGINEEVTIYRDKWGIPAVFAGSNHDVFLGWGYCTAEDRLFQIEMSRRSAWGRMAEVLGEKFIEADRRTRIMGTHLEALRKAKALDQYFRDLLEAFAYGINAYISNHDVAQRQGFRELGLVPQPWTVEDVVGCSEAVGHFETFGHTGYRLVEKVGLEMARECYPVWPDDTPVIVPESEMAKNAEVYERLKGLNIPKPRRPAAVHERSATGSNNCVVTGSKSATGMPILLGDPQRYPRVPPNHYEVALRGGDFHCRGVGFAGVPGLIVGFNRRCAWAGTGLGADRTDLYEEKLHPENPDLYLYRGKWYPLRKRTEVIKVRGGEDVTLEVRSTHHGAICGELLGEQDRHLAFRHPTFETTDTAVLGAMRINVAKSYEEFREAISKWEALGANIIYADVEGNTAYWPTGLVPIRPKGRLWGPVPGWTEEYEWAGYIPFEEKPSLHNPDQDFIVTANNLVVSDWYPYTFVSRSSTGPRFMRIREAIMERDKFDQNDMARLRSDIKCTPEVRALFPVLLAALQSADDVTDEMREAADLLKAWDFRFSKDSIAATIFNSFVRELHQAVARQHLGEDYKLAQFDMLRLAPASRWYDDPSTAEAETRPDLFVKVFGKILADLAEQLGPDKSKWVWGKVSTTKVLHLVEDLGLGDSIKPPDYGDFVMEGSKALTPHVLEVVTYSQVVDLTDVDKSLAVLSVGNSELYTSPHSHDQIQLWSNWRLRPAFLGEDKLKEMSHLATVLTADAPHCSAQNRPDGPR